MDLDRVARSDQLLEFDGVHASRDRHNTFAIGRLLGEQYRAGLQATFALNHTRYERVIGEVALHKKVVRMKRLSTNDR